MLHNVTTPIHWVGGKTKLSNSLIGLAEDHIDFSSKKKYVEPFIGGGGMFFSITQKYNFDTKIISDINSELIHMYKDIKSNAEDLMWELDIIENKYNSLEDIESKKEYYYKLRGRYNETIMSESSGVKQSALFIALSKLGFNGLYRVNKKGLYNVPFGKRKNANLYDRQNLLDMSSLLQDTEILNLDYKKTIQFADKSSVFYIDSPYRPLPNSKSFTAYSKSDFNDEEQEKLSKFCQELLQKNGSFFLSNSDPKQVDPADDFFDVLYSDFITKRVETYRAIGAKNSSRGNIKELLVVGKNI